MSYLPFLWYFLCADVVANMRGDDRANIYADGKLVGNTRYWSAVWNGLIPATTRVVAIHVTNPTREGFAVASFSNGFKTSDEWKCSDTETDGWSDVDFNDTEWSTAISRTDGYATRLGRESPWGGAALIWTTANGSGFGDRFFRGKIG